MIIGCPACNTRYVVADAAVAEPGGRDLRCAKCGHTWHYVAPQVPPPPAPIMVEPEPALPATEPMAAPPLRVDREAASALPTPPAAALAAVAPRGNWAGLAFLVLMLLIGAAIAVGVLAREQIAARWPEAARFYRMVGMIRPEPPGAGLEISRPAPTRTASGLIIEGNITNVAGNPRSVPRLRVVLRDSGHKELEFKVIDPPVSRLQPGEVAHFRASFDHPSDQANDVAVTFAPG